MDMSDRLNAYRRVTGQADTPARRLDEAFTRARHECRRGLAGVDAHDVVAKGNAISRVTEIVTQLLSALDHTLAPALCAHLAGIYHHLLKRLARAHIAFDRAALVEVEAVLGNLHDAFNEAALRSEAAP